MALTATLCFVTKSVHAALCSQVGIGTRLEVIIVTAWRTGCIKVAWWTWAVVARTTVIELTRWALTLALWAIV